MIVSAIAAIGENRELGRNNDLIWRISADLKRFKKLTMGHFVLMGRKTFESIGKVLPGRKFIVVSSQRATTIETPDLHWVKTPEEGMELAKHRGETELFVVGGGSIYTACLPFYQKLYLTRIHEKADDADVFFPSIEMQEWTCEESETYSQHTPPYSYENWFIKPSSQSSH